MSMKAFRKRITEYWEPQQVAVYGTGLALMVILIISATSVNTNNSLLAALCCAAVVATGLSLLTYSLFGKWQYVSTVVVLMAATCMWALLTGASIWSAIVAVVTGVSFASLTMGLLAFVLRRWDEGGDQEI